MSAQAILNDAADHGVRITLNGDNLAYQATIRPRPELLANLKKHKAEIVVLLRNDDACSLEPDLVGLEERKALAIDSVPERYLDAWARLQMQRPANVTQPVWRQAIYDAGKFLDRWGRLAAELGFLPADLFDVPCDGHIGDLCWRLRSLTVIAIGPDHARLSDGSVRWKQAL